MVRYNTAETHMAEKNYITPDGYKKLVDELTELATVERPRVVREVSDAAAEGDRHVYRIVGQDEIEGASGVISWQSPTGKALLGKALGESVTVRWHAGERELTVVSVEYV